MSKGVLKYRKYQKKENSLDPNSEPMFYARAVPTERWSSKTSLPT